MRILYIAMQALEITAFLWILHTNITQNVPTYTVVQGDTYLHGLLPNISSIALLLEIEIRWLYFLCVLSCRL